MPNNINTDDLDLDALRSQSGRVADYLRRIKDDCPINLEDLESQTAHVAGNLKTIQDDDSDLDDLEDRLDRIIAKLERVKQLQDETGTDDSE